jgi:hypothetical protein
VIFRELETNAVGRKFAKMAKKKAWGATGFGKITDNEKYHTIE